MTLHVQTCQGTPGANVTAAASAAGGTAYSLINPSNSAAVTYSDDVPNPCHGGTVIKFDGTLGTTAEVRWTTPDTTTAAQQAVVRFTEKPASGGGVLDWLYNRGSIRNASLRLMDATDGRLITVRRDSDAGTAGRLSSAALTALLGVDIVADLVVVQGTTTTDGTLKARIRRLDDLDGTPVMEYTATNVDVGQIGTHVMNMFQFGKTSASNGNIAPFYMAHHALDDTATDYLPDPPLFADEPEPTGVMYSPDGTTLLPGTLHYSPDGITLLPAHIA